MKNITYINAGAGSGKTYRLTEILTDLISAKKVDPKEVILTTFTTKAANEFKEKAKAKLVKEGLFNEAAKLEHAMIGTVHSVCQRIVNKYWFQLGLPPQTRVMDEEHSQLYISQSLSDIPTDEELAVLHNYAQWFNITLLESTGKSGINYRFWQNDLERVISLATNYEIEDFEESKKQSIAFIESLTQKGVRVDFTTEELRAVIDEHLPFLEGRPQSDANDKRIVKLKTALQQISSPTVNTFNLINSTIGTPKKFGKLAEAFQSKFSGFWTSETVSEKHIEYIKILFDLATRWKGYFAEFKRDNNLIDYNDMEKYMHMLMKEEAVRGDISTSYKYLFVDEFQDSSPIQIKIFDALSDIMEHSYWVGDYKQAIYEFRGTDIELVKAVVDRIRSTEGCNLERLENSWRSLPDIVEMNNALFSSAFSNILSEDDVKLSPERENENGINSLRYFIGGKDADIANNVLHIIKDEGVSPSDIAILARQNKTLGSIADELSCYGIPSSLQCVKVIETDAYHITAALLRLLSSDKDNLSRAEIAYLTEQDYDLSKIINTKLSFGNNRGGEEGQKIDKEGGKERESFLADVPLIKQLMAIKPRLLQQSLPSLVESLVIELNIYDVVKSFDSASRGTSILQAIINKSREYDNRCSIMNLPATIDGFLDFMDRCNAMAGEDRNGVQLHTYHSSKGLDWKYVILTELNRDELKENDFIKRSILGVQVTSSCAPTLETLYPQKNIRFAPSVFAGNTNVPEVLREKITTREDYTLELEKKKEEEKRILYVGMTRPKDVLILNIKDTKSLASSLIWPTNISANICMNVAESWDIFNTKYSFNYTHITEDTYQDADGNVIKYDAINQDDNLALNIEQGSNASPTAPRYLSPSSVRGVSKVLNSQNISERIQFSAAVDDMSVVGDCIHQIFACMSDNKSIDIEALIRSYDLQNVLKDVNAITSAWDKLLEHLEGTHGTISRLYHERPFIHERNGQIINGSIDLVCQTEKGSILVDFKTCPMGHTAVLDPNSEHYAGMYAGQLATYAQALEAAGETVLKQYIFYPVNGLLAEIDITELECR